MKRFRHAATSALLTLTLVLVAPTVAARTPRSVSSTSTPLAALEGRGWWSTLACGACVLGAEVVFVTGASQVSTVATALGPTLVGKCSGVCALAEQ